MTESERIALCAVLGIRDIIRGDFKDMIDDKTPAIRQHAMYIRDEIDELVAANATAYDEELKRADRLDMELRDLQYQIKELIYRIEDSRGRDIRTDYFFKEIKRAVNV